jgi:hypothetical protein
MTSSAFGCVKISDGLEVYVSRKSFTLEFTAGAVSNDADIWNDNNLGERPNYSLSCSLTYLYDNLAVSKRGIGLIFTTV